MVTSSQVFSLLYGQDAGGGVHKKVWAPYPPFPSFSFFHAPNDGIIADMFARRPKKRREEKKSRDGRRVQPAICFNNHHQPRRVEEKYENVKTRTCSQMENYYCTYLIGWSLQPELPVFVEDLWKLGESHERPMQKREGRERCSKRNLLFPLRNEACGATIFFSVSPKKVRDFPERRKFFSEEEKKGAYWSLV